MLRLLRVNVLLELHKYIWNKFTYIFDVYKSTPSDINVEKWPFGVIAIGLTVLLLLVLYLPVLSQDDPPQDHILDQGLLTEDIDQLLFLFDVLRSPRQNLEWEVSAVWEEGLAEIWELDSLGVLNVEVFDECFNFRLRVVNLHLKQASGHFKLWYVALAVTVKCSKGIHYVEVETTLIEQVLLVLYQFQTVQNVAQQSVEGWVLLLLLLKVDSQVGLHFIQLLLVLDKPFWTRVKSCQILVGFDFSFIIWIFHLFVSEGGYALGGNRWILLLCRFILGFGDRQLWLDGFKDLTYIETEL